LVPIWIGVSHVKVVYEHGKDQWLLQGVEAKGGGAKGQMSTNLSDEGVEMMSGVV
jgi:hypothetical protein